jgi:hypothetical protein
MPVPDPARADTRDNAYVFERRVIFRHGDGASSEGRIDTYRRGCFVLESKKLKQNAQTRGFDDGMQRARVQAESYSRALPAEEGRPPFLIVVDVGHVIVLYAEFSRSGATCTPFPDPCSHRLKLADPRAALGDGYVDALRGVWGSSPSPSGRGQGEGGVPDSADFVMFWWQHAADLVRAGQAQRFGFITTNSLRQTFNRRLVEQHINPTPSLPLHLTYAIPDHPWVDSADGAAVRIAMTVGAAGAGEGRLMRVTAEREIGGEGLEVELAERVGLIHADLSIGANVAAAQALRANEHLSNRGFCRFGAGFIVTPEDAAKLEVDAPIKPYRNGRDLTDRPRGVKVIDLFGLSDDELRVRYLATFQHVLVRVKPERDNNNRECRRRNWWLFGEPNPKLRAQLAGLPSYNKSGCFETFPFTDASTENRTRIAALAEHPDLSLTGLSNVLGKLRTMENVGRKCGLIAPSAECAHLSLSEGAALFRPTNCWRFPVCESRFRPGWSRRLRNVRRNWTGELATWIHQSGGKRREKTGGGGVERSGGYFAVGHRGKPVSESAALREIGRRSGWRLFAPHQHSAPTGLSGSGGDSDGQGVADVVAIRVVAPCRISVSGCPRY